MIAYRFLLLCLYFVVVLIICELDTKNQNNEAASIPSSRLCMYSSASALLPFQALSLTVKITLWMAARCDMWTLGHWDGLVICTEGLWPISGNFFRLQSNCSDYMDYSHYSDYTDYCGIISIVHIIKSIISIITKIICIIRIMQIINIFFSRDYTDYTVSKKITYIIRIIQKKSIIHIIKNLIILIILWTYGLYFFVIIQTIFFWKWLSWLYGLYVIIPIL